MKFALERVTDPDIEPVTLAEMKRHLREFDSVTSADSDITDLIVGAREWVEDYTGRALIDQTWRLTIDQHGYLLGNLIDGIAMRGWFAGNFGYYGGIFRWHHEHGLLLRKAPVLAITSFVTVDAAGIETTIDAAQYELREEDSKWPRIVPLSGATWMAATLRVTFRAGFADRLGSPQQGAEVVPVRFKQAMKLWVESMYDRDQVMMPLLLKTAEALIKSERAEISLA
jgi:hypothetical protein